MTVVSQTLVGVCSYHPSHPRYACPECDLALERVKQLLREDV